MCYRSNGFSLVELSIVLVILGLLTGGILAGQSLIRAAELRAVTVEYQRYLTATQSFRDRFMAIPGDMRNATRFWGDNGLACADMTITDGSPGTCDGNGDGMMDYTGSIGATTEVFQFWNQLALAGLIEGTYTGLSGSGGVGHAVIGTNVPASKLSNAGWSVWRRNNYPGDSTLYALDYGNLFAVGAPNGTTITYFPALKPEEAWNIDSKLDDGKPARGHIIAMYWNDLCATADDGSPAKDDLNAHYLLSDSSIRCSLQFIKQF